MLTSRIGCGNFRWRSSITLQFRIRRQCRVFSCIPQPGDAIIYDEHIHASVHDGMRASRVDRPSLISFDHNSLPALRSTLMMIRNRTSTRQSVFVAVESLYSMDGTFAPLKEMVGVIEEIFPSGNAYLIVDEAHSTGIYGPEGRGRVAMLGLEDRVLARLIRLGRHWLHLEVRTTSRYRTLDSHR